MGFDIPVPIGRLSMVIAIGYGQAPYVKEPRGRIFHRHRPFPSFLSCSKIRWTHVGQRGGEEEDAATTCRLPMLLPLIFSPAFFREGNRIRREFEWGQR